MFKKQVLVDFPATDAENLVDMLEEFSTCFTLRDGELGMCQKAEHRINTETAALVHQPPNKTTWIERAILQEQVEEILKKGVIERSSSPWASPVVLVKKKGGSWRFCVDYRRLNAISVKDVYLLQRIEETLPRMGSACLFNMIDLESGYWQVSIDEDDKEKTAFVTPDGLYQFLVMPFGFALAPEIFQRMMDLVLAGLRRTICLLYLDDIIIYAVGMEEHLIRFCQVWTALRSAGLKIKLVKCQFGASEIKTLGYVISGLGYKIDGFVNFLTPSAFNKFCKNFEFVRSFVGLCFYYCWFIPQLAQSAKPLTDFYKKEGCFPWKARKEAIFLALKESLARAAILD